jgi:hypothetical protein
MRKPFSTIQKFWEGIELDSSLLTGEPIVNWRKRGENLNLKEI